MTAPIDTTGYGPCLATKALIRLLIADVEGMPIYQCPHCGNQDLMEDYEFCGADWECVFCPQCQREVFDDEESKREYEKKRDWWHSIKKT